MEFQSPHQNLAKSFQIILSALYSSVFRSARFPFSHESILVDYDLQESWWQFDPQLRGLFQFCVMISGAIAGALLLKLEPIGVEFIIPFFFAALKIYVFLLVPICLWQECLKEGFLPNCNLQNRRLWIYIVWFIFLRQLWQLSPPTLFIIVRFTKITFFGKTFFLPYVQKVSSKLSWC